MNSNDLVISTERVSKSFGEVQALKSLDLRVSPCDQMDLHSVQNRIPQLNPHLISVNQIVLDGQTINYEVNRVNHGE